jgi:hypothetical protein
MKTTKIQKIIKSHLLSSFKSFACTGRMMFLEPRGSVLCGIYFEDSSFNQTTLYVWVFVQPLYVPSEHVHFTFGHRLINRAEGGLANESWNLGSESEYDEHQIQSLANAIRGDAIPYIKRLETPQDIANNLSESTGLLNNVFVREAVAYSRAKIGEYANAKKELEALMYSVDPDDPWYSIKTRAQELLTGINGGSKSVSDLFEKWEHETAVHLHLPHYGNEGQTT